MKNKNLQNHMIDFLNKHGVFDVKAIFKRDKNIRDAKYIEFYYLDPLNSKGYYYKFYNLLDKECKEYYLDSQSPKIYIHGDKELEKIFKSNNIEIPKVPTEDAKNISFIIEIEKEDFSKAYKIIIFECTKEYYDKYNTNKNDYNPIYLIRDTWDKMACQDFLVKEALGVSQDFDLNGGHVFAMIEDEKKKD